MGYFHPSEESPFQLRTLVSREIVFLLSNSNIALVSRLAVKQR